MELVLDSLILYSDSEHSSIAVLERGLAVYGDMEGFQALCYGFGHFQPGEAAPTMACEARLAWKHLVGAKETALFNDGAIHEEPRDPKKNGT